MESYKKCLKKNKTMHHKCQDVSKVYLQCRQENALMAETPLEEVRIPFPVCDFATVRPRYVFLTDTPNQPFPPDQLGYGHKVENVGVKTDRKEDRGFTAGAHIKERKNKGWFW